MDTFKSIHSKESCRTLLYRTDLVDEQQKMTTVIKRKLYKRGSSFETTIPMPLLFAVDKTKKNNVLFKYDPASNRWYIEFEETESRSK